MGQLLAAQQEISDLQARILDLEKGDTLEGVASRLGVVESEASELRDDLGEV